MARTDCPPEAGRPRPRLLFVNAHYYPDVASTGQHLTDLAEYLSGAGYETSVLTGRTKYVGERMAAPGAERHNGVSITRVRGTSFGRRSHLGRLIDYASFYALVFWRLLGRRPADGVVFLTTPPLLSFLGRVALALRGQRYGIWSMDLHPDAEFAAGMLNPRGVVGRLLEWANATGYRRADFVVDLGTYMKRRLVAKGVAPERTHTVHVWSRVEEVEPTPRARNPLIRELGLEGRFVVMYSGNAGLVHDFGAVLEAMLRMRDDPRVYFLFVGGGPQRARIETFARQHALANFSYREYFPREQLRHSLSVADAHLITLREPFAGIAVPGKLYGIMASGRPAIFVGPERSESAEAIRDADCGVVIDPASDRDPAGTLVSTIRRWADQPDAASRLGAAGREAFLARYERLSNCEAFERVIRRTWGAGRAALLSDASVNTRHSETVSPPSTTSAGR